MGKIELRDAMKALGLTVRGLAALVEVSPSTVTRWRKGTRRVPGGVARYLELRVKLLNFTTMS
jgi:transcriptional regulator with XRE-family HTH domain